MMMMIKPEFIFLHNFSLNLLTIFELDDGIIGKKTHINFD